MSKGAFTIIDSYVGKQELHLTATKALHDRLKQIYETRLDSENWVSPSEAMPTFRDIEASHMFYLKRTFKPFVAFGYEYYKSRPEISSSFNLPGPGGSVSTRFNLRSNNGDFIHDQVIRVVLEGKGNPQDPPNSTRYRFCDFPGIRLLKNVSYRVDEYPIDDYTPKEVLDHIRIRSDANNSAGFKSMVGQQSVIEGSYYHENRNIDQVLRFKNGAQTFKPYQPDLELWIPLIFDYNKDVGRSLHNKIIGSQQIYIEMEFESFDNIIQASDANGNILPNAITSMRVKELELYTKNIYLNPEINDLFSERNNLSIIRVYKQQKRILTNPSGSIQLTDLKFPIEVLHFGFRPVVNTSVKDNPKFSFTDWHQFCKKSRTCVPVPAVIDSLLLPGTQQLVIRTARIVNDIPTVSNIGLIIHGNELYPLNKERFYADYIPYSLPRMNPTGECGEYTVSFSHDPLGFNPAGHVNNSTARELFISYSSDVISDEFPVEFVCSGQAINFVLYGEGTFKLKYIA